MHEQGIQPGEETHILKVSVAGDSSKHVHFRDQEIGEDANTPGDLKTNETSVLRHWPGRLWTLYFLHAKCTLAQMNLYIAFQSVSYCLLLVLSVNALCREYSSDPHTICLHDHTQSKIAIASIIWTILCMLVLNRYVGLRSMLMHWSAAQHHFTLYTVSQAWLRSIDTFWTNILQPIAPVALQEPPLPPWILFFYRTIWNVGPAVSGET